MRLQLEQLQKSYEEGLLKTEQLPPNVKIKVPKRYRFNQTTYSKLTNKKNERVSTER